MAQVEVELISRGKLEAGSGSEEVIRSPASSMSKKAVVLSVICIGLVVVFSAGSLEFHTMQRVTGLDFESKALTSSASSEILDIHNAYRCMHNAPALTWSSSIAANAQKWVEEVGGQMTHSPITFRSNVAGYGYLGENLAWGSRVIGWKAVRMWYDEIEDTNDGLIEGFTSGTGHYTQVVWVGTKQVGCASSGNLLVCQYGPGGNMRGAYTQNVKAPTKSASDCNAPEEAASLGAYLASTNADDLDCGAACKADDKGSSFGTSWSRSSTSVTTTCKCKSGKLTIKCSTTTKKCWT